MSEVLLWLVCAIYGVAGVDLWNADKQGLGVAFMGYSISNIGLIMAARQ